jgi:hypothetical protein
MDKEILQAWSDIEKFLISLSFDGAPESSDAPWTAVSELDGFYGLQGGGLTPLDAVKNFIIQVQEMRRVNNEKHGVTFQ